MEVKPEAVLLPASVAMKWAESSSALETHCSSRLHQTTLSLTMDLEPALLENLLHQVKYCYLNFYMILHDISLSLLAIMLIVLYLIDNCLTRTNDM